MQTQTIQETIELILEHGVTHADSSLRMVEGLKPWQHSSQGDVDFTLLPCVPPTAVETAPVIQLAPGYSKGSRHCVRAADMPNIRFWKLPNPNPLQGHMLECFAPVVIEHPEHGDQQLEAGVWFVKFQRRHAAEVKRVQD